jgi:uncharacterized membrane protein YqiK
MSINFLATLLLIAFASIVLIYISGIIRYIPNDRLGVLEKLWSFEGSVQSGLIALNGEAGYQPEVVRGGFHFFMPFQYRLHAVPLVTVPQGQIGYVFARDGTALPPSQTLAGNDNNVDFQDVRAFLTGGGQKGPQRKILREGTYAFNANANLQLRWKKPTYNYLTKWQPLLRRVAALNPSSSKTLTTASALLLFTMAPHCRKVRLLRPL